MTQTYDYLVVGAGLFGATFAHEIAKKGKRVLVIVSSASANWRLRAVT